MALVTDLAADICQVLPAARQHDHVDEDLPEIAVPLLPRFPVDDERLARAHGDDIRLAGEDGALAEELKRVLPLEGDHPAREIESGIRPLVVPKMRLQPWLIEALAFAGENLREPGDPDVREAWALCGGHGGLPLHPGMELQVGTPYRVRSAAAVVQIGVRLWVWFVDGELSRPAEERQGQRDADQHADDRDDADVGHVDRGDLDRRLQGE